MSPATGRIGFDYGGKTGWCYSVAVLHSAVVAVVVGTAVGVAAGDAVTERCLGGRG